MDWYTPDRRHQFCHTLRRCRLRLLVKPGPTLGLRQACASWTLAWTGTPVLRYVKFCPSGLSKTNPSDEHVGPLLRNRPQTQDGDEAFQPFEPDPLSNKGRSCRSIFLTIVWRLLSHEFPEEDARLWVSVGVLGMFSALSPIKCGQCFLAAPFCN